MMAEKKKISKKDSDKYKTDYETIFAQFQRLQADFDNYRKRAEKEKTEICTHAKEDIIIQLLYVIDNLERCEKSAIAGDDFETLKTGVELTLKQLKDTLKKEGLEEISSTGKKFDPEKHEALLTTESDEHEDDTIAEEIQKGYIFKDKVIRPSKVKVVKNS